MSKAIGSAKCKVKGQYCKTVPDSVELNYGGEERTAVIADDTFNYRSVPVPANLKVKFLHIEKTKVKMLNDLEEDVIEIEFDNGVTYTLEQATRIGSPLTTSSSDGQIAAEFSGMITLKK